MAFSWICRPLYMCEKFIAGDVHAGFSGVIEIANVFWKYIMFLLKLTHANDISGSLAMGKKLTFLNVQLFVAFAVVSGPKALKIV
jgi:hypothetical protein